MPIWLRIQENGAIGEARTLAFLMDRFWILERSIDADGADLIVQRRFTRGSLLDRDAPRLGIIQAKFYQHPKTTQYVHKEYVLDEQGRPRDEFFLVCHSGREDEARMYFLAAENIASEFKLTGPEHSHKNCFAVPGRQILDARWEILDRRRVLGQIEQALVNADFAANRRFLSWVIPSAEPNESIRPRYVEEIETSVDIRKCFFELRKSAEEASRPLIEALDLLQRIVRTDDPNEAIQLADEFDDYLSPGSPHGRLYDDELKWAIAQHRLWYSRLEKSGMLNRFASVRRQIGEGIERDCLAALPFAPEAVYVLGVTFDPTTLELQPPEGSVQLHSAFQRPLDCWGDLETCGVLDVSPGSVTGFLVPAPYEPWVKDRTTVDERDFPSRGAMYLLDCVMRAILEGWHAAGGSVET